ncbi:MAG: DUF2431 domain-containing protein [Terriglobus roseus]|nr:DUF2431 domain-containing protein [Terriglobus roseus]
MTHARFTSLRKGTHGSDKCAGDFSFARSLVEHHGCRHVTATSLDSQQELHRKHPRAREAVEYLKRRGQRVVYGVDATKLAQRAIRRPPLPPDPLRSTNEQGSENGEDGVDEGDEAGGEDGDHDLNEEHSPDNRHSEDDSFEGFSSDDIPEAASTPAASGPRGWDTIAFNFPHVGGKSTDVNRQVRHNQSLLVSFFRAALPLLAPAGATPARPAGGAIAVALFEGEPYTLWNVRDLGRHAGLRAERSWRFGAEAFPGYGHARTMGEVRGGGGWRGEQRAARVYAFVGREAPAGAALVGGSREEVGRMKSSGESDDEDEDEG